MARIKQIGWHWLAGLMVVALAACGGSGGGGGAAPYIPTTPTPGLAVINTLAGAVPGADGIGAAARFDTPSGSVIVGGNLYVADTDNSTIRKIVLATGAVTTLAGEVGNSGSADGTGTAARFDWPTGITSDGTSLFVVDGGNYTIRKIVIASGVVTTLAGSAGNSGSNDGTGTAARFYWPKGIATDGTNLYVADDRNSTIRKIVIATGVVTTLAGSAGSYGSTDGTGTAALFYRPRGIACDGTNLYVTDSYNHTIRKIAIASGVVTTLAGTAGAYGNNDGTGATARFDYPEGIIRDGANLYVTDFSNHTTRKIVIATGDVTTLAGTAGSRGNSDGTGAVARFNNPDGIASDGTNLYVSDSVNQTIRKIVIASGQVTTLSGAVPGADGTGAAASFAYPRYGLVVGANLYVADENNHTIRKVVLATGVVTTVAGTAGNSGSSDGTGVAARFNKPRGIASDGTNLYMADTGNHTIRKIVIATGVVTTLAGTAGSTGSSDGTGAAARFNWPSGVTSDGTNLYVTETQNHTIRKIVIATGAVTTLAGTAASSGSSNGTGAAAKFYWPEAITNDGTNLYVADKGNHTIRKIVISSGVVTTLAGTVGSYGSVDGTGTAARFYSPYGITNDGTNLYVTDSETNIIRKIVIATGAVTTLAGTAGSWGSADGIGAAARFGTPLGIIYNAATLYVMDVDNNTIRKITNY